MADEDKLQFAQNPELETAKAWWKENGRAIIGGVALGLSGVIGFNYWQSHQENQAEDASALYAQMQAKVGAVAAAKAAAEAEVKAKADAEAKAVAEAEAQAKADAEAKAESDAASETETEAASETEMTAESESDAASETETIAEGVAESETETASETETTAEAETEAVSETDTTAETEAVSDTETTAETEATADPETTAREQVKSIAADLMSDYGATPYAIHAAFTLAKFSVENDDLEGAARALRWVLKNVDADELAHVSRLRLATVLLAQGEADGVVALLKVENTGGFAARYHELEGDAHYQKGDRAAARDAYQRSTDLLSDTAPERALLTLKLDDLGGAE